MEFFIGFAALNFGLYQIVKTVDLLLDMVEKVGGRKRLQEQWEAHLKTPFKTEMK